MPMLYKSDDKLGSCQGVEGSIPINKKNVTLFVFGDYTLW
jgi:hypothetical protein